MKDKIKFTPRGCIRCWKCIEVCPRKVIGKARFLFHRHAILADAGSCTGCGRCMEVCPRGCFHK